jgi:DNA repair ATPase RecN
MKKQLISLGIGLFALLRLATAQGATKDSLSLVGKISEDKDKLSKLQGQIADRTKEKEETAVQAQEAADDNRKAANKLSNDPQDRSLARNADSRASDARDAAKKARRAEDALEELQKEIRNMTERIAKEETKLNKYVQESKNLRAAPVVTIPKDSTRG